MTYSYDMAYSPQTYPITVTAATIFATPLIVRGAALTCRVITRSVTGSRTWPAKNFTPSHMLDDPLIFAGCAVKRPKENPARTTCTTVLENTPPLEATEQKGNLLIRELWQNGTVSVHDMRVMNTNDKSHLKKPLEKFLQEAERAK